MRSIRYSLDAKKDLEDIFAYLNHHSETAAEKLAETIDQRAGVLAVHPAVGRDRGDLVVGLRSTVIGNYVLFFRATATTLQIVRVLHGARDIDSIFQLD